MSTIAESKERKALVFSLMKNTYFPKAFRDEFVGVDMNYTPGFVGKQIARGVKLEDERKVPAFAREVGVGVSSPEWTEKSEEYWAEFSSKVPVGLVSDNNKIEGGTEINGSYKVDTEGNIYPDNINEYMLYNLMEQDDKVAKSVSDWAYRNDYDFFLIDKTIQQRQEVDAVKKSANVLVKVAKLIGVEGKEDIMKYILQVYDKDVSPIEVLVYNKTQLQEGMIELTKKNPDAILEAMKNEDILIHKAFMKQIIHSGGILPQGNAFFYQNEKIASNEDELILWIKNPENNGVISKLQAQIDYYKTNNVIS